MNLRTSFFIAIVASVISINAHAGFYVEPRIGYETGTFEGAALKDDLSILHSDNKTSGMSVGAMIGYKWSTFSLGVEGMGATLTNEEKTTKEESDFVTTDMGFFLRWDLGAFHITTSFLSSKATDESLKDMGLDDALSGTGMRIGIGYRLFKNFSINLDYIAVDYKKSDEPTFLAMAAERTTTMVGISFPFGLDGKR